MKETGNILKVYPTYGKAGNAFYELYSQPKGSDLVQQCVLYPERVIPVIFIPGVMGSNLKSKSNKKGKDTSVWNLDSSLDVAKKWFGADARIRKQKLNPALTEVDDSGRVDEKDEFFLLKNRRERGWGSVAYTSYASFLSWLQDELNKFEYPEQGERYKLLNSVQEVEFGDIVLQKKELDLTYRYLYPVFAVGYNWLQSNADSAVELGKKIKKMIQFYRKKGRKCEKVILITHSMGGLVARHYTQKLGGEKNVLGVIHGVMPALGAAATYRRMKAGTEYPEGNIQGWMTSKTLGGDAEAMTAVLSQSPGPMQLLPGREYGMRWLKIMDGKDVYFYPKEEPYEEIYLQRDKWWGLCEEQFINPGQSFDKTKLDGGWLSYAEMLKDEVRTFIEGLSGKYHINTYAFYSADKSYPSYGDIYWQSKTPMIEQWMNKGRRRKPEDGRALDRTEKFSSRSVSTPLEGDGWAQGIYQTWRLLPPQEAGDGTVPEHSGRIPIYYLQARYQVSVEHEPAYKNTLAQQFTLRALVKIVQEVQHTKLAYL